MGLWSGELSRQFAIPVAIPSLLLPLVNKVDHCVNVLPSVCVGYQALSIKSDYGKVMSREVSKELFKMCVG